MSKEKSIKIFDSISYALSLTAVFVFLAGCSVYIYINHEIIKSAGYFSTILSIVGLVIGKAIFYFREKKLKSSVFGKIAFASTIITLLAGLYIVVFQLILDYFQPLSTFDIPIICLGVFLFLIGLSALFSIFSGFKNNSLFFVSLLALLVFAGGAVWANVQGYGLFNKSVDSTIVFSSGENGYATYRIPSLALVENETDAQNSAPKTIYAFAEGRRNSSLDNGEIDVVYKFSKDAGKTWSESNLALNAEKWFSGKGKVSDPTPVYDKARNKLCLMFRVGLEKNNYSTVCYYIEGTINPDDTIAWDYSNIININEKIGMNVSPGPAKGNITDDGKIVFPVRGEGCCFIVYTQDGAKTWRKGEAAGNAGETDFDMIDENRAVMIGRTGAMSSLPRNNHIKIALSDDGGLTWSTPLFETTLKTPVVMSSVTSKNNAIYCTHCDTYLTRANLSYSVSVDNGKNWTTTRLYDGPSGYSVAEISENETLFIIAEIGKVEYHEEIRLFSVEV